jgi:two-component system, sensor histidine kinase PdtaS
VATLVELTRQNTLLSREEVGHLQRLVSEWGMLADFCFADLLLYVKAPDGPDDARWLVVGQVRPATAQTLYLADWVGTWANDTERPLLSRAFTDGAVVAGTVSVEGLDEPAQMTAIPVRHRGRVVAVLTREWSEHKGRQPGQLERTYLGLFDRFASMITAGSFPYPGRQSSITAAPRVGDGAIVLDDAARVVYASPNAVSALHRVGISANAAGIGLAELGFNDAPVRAAFERKEPVLEESDQTADVTLLTYCIPLVEPSPGGDDLVTGGVVLIRDVTELRRRDRLLLSKDATIREIHHRVKNNLQTISSLLRLQARRLSSEEAKAAVNESVRRIRTIALVHETLSREPGDDVAFIEIVRPLLRLAEEGYHSADRPVRFSARGEGGKLPATVATPLSVVLTELLQNAVDHEFPLGSGGGHVQVMLDNDGTRLHIRVIDDGLGVPEGFNMDRGTGLGLTIVKTLVTTELGGTITIRPGTPEDFSAADLAAPVRGTGTVVDLTVPFDTSG